MRVLLKISGEALRGPLSSGIDHAALDLLVDKILALHGKGMEIGLVIGAGNIFRGLENIGTNEKSLNLHRVPADMAGMLATLLNGTIVQEALTLKGCDARMMSAIECPEIAATYDWRKAQRWFQKKRIIIFAGGTGHPYFTTDTAAALRASEMEADLLLKVTMHVDGIYDQDPRKHPEAKKFDSLSYEEVLEQKLGIIDLTAVTLCMTNKVPIRVINYESDLHEAIIGGKIGTLVT